MRRIGFWSVVLLSACARPLAAPGGGGLDVHALAEEYCAYLARCVGPIVDGRGDYVSREICVRLLGTTLKSYVFRYDEQAASEGRTVYAPEKFAACLDAFRSGCNVDMTACWEIFHGTLENGAACRADEECASGWCDREESCPGVCTEPAHEGESCEVLSCARDLVCDEGTCRAIFPAARLGESCGARPCAAGLYCDDNSVCQARLPEDAPCEYDEQCEVHLVCIQRRCREPEIVTEEGKACGADEGLFCDTGRGLTCALGPSGIGTCTAFKENGEKCYDSETEVRVACNPLAGLYCDWDSFHTHQDVFCQPLKQVGEACWDANECATAVCQDGVCQAFLDPCTGY